MPRKPIDYSKTIFYRIVCNDLNIKDCYIGHTTNFIKRKQQHKQHCNNENLKDSNFKVYKFIRENGGWNNWSMIMIEQISCENFNEASKLERKFLEEFNGTLNGNIPTRTKKEWAYSNKDKLKDYRKNNDEKIKEQKKEYQKLTIYCDCCKKDINKNNKARHYKSNTHIKNLSII
jgi:hypothetical protein